MSEPLVLGKPEVFWVAGQFIVAVLGVVGLFFYTLYTRKMMQVAELGRRASFTPIFVMESFGVNYVSEEGPNRIIEDIGISIANVGEGPAINLMAWDQKVSQGFRIGDSSMLKQNGARENERGTPLLRKDQSFYFSFERITGGDRWLFVFDSIDAAGGKHQLQILRKEGIEEIIQVNLNHSFGDTFGERFVAGIGRLLEIERNVQQTMDRFDQKKTNSERQISKDDLPE